jgi:SulP family sulfate permease
MATFFFTLFLGIVNGILLGIALSLISIVQKASKPHYAILGKLPGSKSYRNIKRFPEAKVVDGVLIIRYDQDLFFGNAEHFYNTIVNELKSRKTINKLIIKGGSFHNLDSTAMYKINRLNEYCKSQGVRLIFTNLIGPVRDAFRQSGLYQKIGEDNFFLSHTDALLENEEAENNATLSNQYSKQTNTKN